MTRLLRTVKPWDSRGGARFQLKVDLAGFTPKRSFFQVSPSIQHRKILKALVIRLIEDPKVENLGQLFNLTELTLRGLMQITGLTEDEIIGIFVFKKGISYIDPSSTEARLVALGEM